VVKHAQARNIKISLKYCETSICLKLRDDGTGFDLQTARESGGMGLRGIEERVRKIAGSLAIESSHGTGTRLTVIAPLPNE
jgi:signal transduction histidine kinase